MASLGPAMAIEDDHQQLTPCAGSALRGVQGGLKVACPLSNPSPGPSQLGEG